VDVRSDVRDIVMNRFALPTAKVMRSATRLSAVIELVKNSISGARKVHSPRIVPASRKLALLYFPEGTKNSEGNPSVGWMVDGWKEEQPGQPDFPKWHVLRAFDSAEDCQTAKAELVLTTPPEIKVDRQGFAAALPYVTQQAACISTDDPRLRE
jgi:hypothetical protein